MSRYEVEKDWVTAAGFRAVVTMGDMGFRCGYVGVPEHHPLHGIKYMDPTLSLQKPDDDEPVGKRGILTIFCMAHSEPDERETRLRSPEMVFDVHGGVTYTDKGDYPIESDLWWFGYDCGHAGDAPAPGSTMDRFRTRTLYTPLSEDGPDDYANGDVHRTLDYCIAECESLAQQIRDKTVMSLPAPKATQ